MALLIALLFFWGPAASKLAAAMLRGSLFARPCAGFARWVWPAATAAQRWARPMST